MMTLREFIEKVNFHEHYRIYQPNRDCLIFESYFKVHSPYYFDKEHEDKREWFNHDYYNNNDYCDDVYKVDIYDEETKTFLDRFGNYEVFSLECSSFKPCKMYRDKNEDLKIEYLEDERYPGHDYIGCFNVFIR
jgi:hypothetical protein